MNHKAFFLSDGMYYIVSRQPGLRMKNDSRVAEIAICNLICQICIVRPNCRSIFSYYTSDFVRTSTWTIVEPTQTP